MVASRGGSLVMTLLVCAAGAVHVIAAEPPAETKRQRIEKLTDEIAKLHAAGKLEPALKKAEELVKTSPRDGRAHYGLAGLLSRLGRADDALTALERAVKLHDVHPELMRRDDDFQSLRDRPRFAELVAAAEADLRRQQGQAKAVWTVTLPREFDPWRPAPLIVALHGYGGRADAMAKLWTAAAESYGAILVTPEGQVAAQNAHAWGGAGEAQRSVLSAAGDTRRRFRIDPKRTVLTGFSQGGTMTWEIALSTPRSFAAIIPIAGPFNSQASETFKSNKLVGLRVCAIVGGADRNETVSSMRLASSMFERAGAKVDLRLFKGVGHDMPPEPDLVLLDALAFVWPSAETKDTPTTYPTGHRRGP